MDNATYTKMLFAQQHMVDALEHARLAAAGISNLLNNHVSQETKTVQKTDDEMGKIVGDWWKREYIGDYTITDNYPTRLDVNKICKHMNQILEQKYCTLRVHDVMWSDVNLYVWEVSGLNENGV
jgi:hypothetical protein